LNSSATPHAAVGLVQRLSAVATAAPERTAFVFLADGETEAGRLTFGELEARVRSLAARLEAAGLCGERAILLYPSGLDYVVAFVACLRAGVISAPVPDVAAGREARLLPRLAAVARDARPTAILTVDSRREAAEKLSREIGGGIVPDVITTNDVAPAEGPPDAPPVLDSGALAFLQYTSGSTSTPKGVMISQGNLDYTCRDINASWKYDETSLTVSWLPIFHDMGLIVGICVPIYTGSCCVLMPPEAFVKKPLTWIQAISDRKASHSAAPNFAYDLAARKITDAEIAAMDLSAWRVSLSSAEPVRKETMDTFTDAFTPAGFRREVFCPGFGLAESTVKVTASASGAMPIVRELDAESFEAGLVADFDTLKTGARMAYAIGCGGPILDTEIRIVDPDSCVPVAKDHIGEIWVRSPSIAGGYLDRPDETAATFDGRLASGDPRAWMRTGDLGFQDPDGELYCTGRIKDLIVLHGRNVYPQDVERIAEHAAPGVRPGCSASFSIDLYGEERLCVIAEFDPARGDAEAAADAIIARLAELAELPVFGVLLVPTRALPKTSSGKVQRTFAKRGLVGLKFPALAARFVRPIGSAARAASAGKLEDKPWAKTDGALREAGFDLAAGLEVLDVHEAAEGETRFCDPARLFAEDLTVAELLLGVAETQAAEPAVEVDASGSATALLLELLGTLTGQDTSRLDASCAFSRFGLDSVFAVELAADLEERLGCDVPATLIWDYPTVGDAADALADLVPAGTFAAEAASPEAPASESTDAGREDLEVTREAPIESGATEESELPARAIAIVGVGCRLPGADGLDEYRDLIFEGKSGVVEIPRERWDIDAWYDSKVGTPGRMNTRRAGLISGIDLFDETLFGISTREASRMDPQQRLLLETTWEAIENAGVAPDSLRGQAVGVFVGVGSADYQRIQLSDPDSIDAYAATGNAMSVAANRISYCFDLRGPSLAVDTACSASLVATHLARQSLLDGECDAAVIAGVNAILSPEWTVAFSQAHMMAPDGMCKTFSEGADGYVRGEGCGVVLAMRLEDAVEQGLDILAVIRGSAVAHGGHTNGLTAPSGPEQTRVIERALSVAGVEPAGITYVEAHGTGTELGDPIELRALSAALKPGRAKDQPILMGSAKASIGHLEAAAGVAGLIKAALCVRHGVVPPHLNFTGPNPHVDFEAHGLEVVTERREWPAGAPRRAGISSFGFGGTNAHVIVEAPPALATGEVTGGLDHVSFHLASTTPEALAGNATRLAEWIAANEHLSLQTLAAACNQSRADLPERASAVGKSREELIEALHGLGSLEEPFGTARSRSVGSRPRVLCLFPGQGSQYAGMAAELAASHAGFRAELERCGAVLRAHMDRPLAEVLGSEELLARTRYAQPAILAVSWALFCLWRDAGLEPDACLGHSVGEVAAACAAGALDIDQGLVFLAKRGALLDRLPEGGGMAAVIGSGDDFEARLAAVCEAAGLVIAAFNAPGIATVAGDEAALEVAAADFKAAGLRLTQVAVSHAFHSPLMEPALAELEQLAGALDQRVPRTDLFSSRTGLRVEAALDASHWATQLREPVQFQAALEAALANDNIDAVLELGAHPVTSAFCGRLVRGQAKAPAVLGSLRKKEPDARALLAAVGKLWTLGVRLDERALLGTQLPKTLPVRPPRYAFEPRRHWITLQGESERRSTALYFRPEMARSSGLRTAMSTPSDPASLAQEVARLFREQNAIIARLAGLDMAGLGAAAPVAAAAELDLAHDEKDLATRVRRIVAGVAGANPDRIQPAHALHRDIGFDSLMAVELDRRLRKAFPSLPEGEELFTQETSLEELVAMVDAAQENSDVDDLTEFQRRPREYGTYAELIRKDPKDTYVGGTFKAETHELHDITIDGNSICGQLDVINKYSGTASFHLTQMAAYSFVVQLIQGYICHKHGVKKDGIGMPKLNGIRMEWHTLVRVSKDVPAKLTELGHTEENGVYVYRFEFDVADGGVSGEITGFLPISQPPAAAADLNEPAQYATHAELIGMDPKDTYTGGTFQAEEQTIHHLLCDKKTLTGKLDVKNQYSGTKHFHLTQMGTYSYIVQLMLGYFCYKHGVEKDALGMPTLKEFKIDWTEMVTFDTDIPAEITEVDSSFNRGWYTIRFDFTVGSPDTGEGGRGFLVGMIPEPGTSAG